MTGDLEPYALVLCPVVNTIAVVTFLISNLHPNYKRNRPFLVS